MAVSLYTSRVVLASLGVEDFGIYNVVGGIVGMFGFLNASMVGATQRYLNYAMGKGDKVLLHKVFSSAFFIHLGIAVLIFLLSEVFGLWFLNYKMVLPPERLFAANVVFQVSLIGLVGLVGVVYNACFIAHEKMDFYAYVSIFDTLAKLGIAYLISSSSGDRLIFYGCLMTGVSLLSFFLAFAACYRWYPESHVRFHRDKALYKEMFSFAGWNLFGSFAWMLRDQGVNLVINVFTGPVVNAARGVALQVSNAVQGFVGNFTVALSPQITKTYAAGKMQEMETLAYRCSKFSFLLLFFIAFPLLLNLDFVLGLWLKEVPHYTPIFILLIIMDAMVGAIFNTPFITSLMATGNIRNYQIVVSTVMLLVVPVSYVLLYFGLDVTSVFYTIIVVTALAGIARYMFCIKQLHFSPLAFGRLVFMPVAKFIVASVPIPLAVKYYNVAGSGWINFLFLCVLSVGCCGTAGFYCGLTNHERQMVFGMIKNKLKR